MLEIISMTLGPVETNSYLVADTRTNEAVVIDPAWDGQVIAAEALRRGWRITTIWLTHAHFDHIAGAAGIAQQVQPLPPVALHPGDLPLEEARRRFWHARPWPALIDFFSCAVVAPGARF
jgi:glyoxylase-like metal-dependent hydrolase (beta-lactamase superfamily II)